MGILLEKYRDRLGISYDLFGISADVTQLGRAYLRGDSRGMKKNVLQIIRKLEKIRKIF